MSASRLRHKRELRKSKSATMQAQGKYYYIKSNYSGLVVEAEGGNVYPGVRLITMHQKQGAQASSQLFYTDPATGTIRSNMNDYCIDIMSDSLVLNPYQPGNGSQEWNLTGKFITNKKNPALTMDIQGQGRAPGSRMTIWNYEGKASQQWTIEYQNTYSGITGFFGNSGQQTASTVFGFGSTSSGSGFGSPSSGLCFGSTSNVCKAVQYFQLVSELHGKVLDVKGGNRAAGTPVVVWSKPSGDRKIDNQLWYEDQTGVIRSKLNNFALDATAKTIVLNPYSTASVTQQWILKGNRIVNRDNTNEVIDISGAKKEDGAEVCAWPYKASPNQHWTAVYI